MCVCVCVGGRRKEERMEYDVKLVEIDRIDYLRLNVAHLLTEP